MNWLLLTIASALFASISRILQKILLKDNQNDPFAFGFIFQAMVAVVLFIFSLATGTFEVPNLGGLFWHILAMGVLYSLGNLLLFKAFKTTEASEASIIFASGTVWSVLSALLFLGEKISLLNGVGIMVILLGVAIVNYQRSSWRLSQGHLYALCGAIAFGVAFTNDAYIISRYNHVPSYLVIAFLLPAILTLIFSPKSIPHLKHFLNVSVMRSVLLCSFLYALSALFIFTAYKIGGQAAVISPIHQSSLIFTVTLSYFFLKERDQLFKKILGTTCVFVGVLLLL